jgi:hypothetical protein
MLLEDMIENKVQKSNELEVALGYILRYFVPIIPAG